MMRKEFEYKVDNLYCDEYFQKTLNKRALDGWKLFQVHFGGFSDSRYLIWEREKSKKIARSQAVDKKE